MDPKEVHGEDFPGETFCVLKEKEIRLYGEYRTRRLAEGEAWYRLGGSLVIGRIVATFKQIQVWVNKNYDFVSETCWIADVKSQSGLPMRKAPNRKGAERVKPCPPQKVEAIRAALRHFGMIS